MTPMVRVSKGEAKIKINSLAPKPGFVFLLNWKELGARDEKLEEVGAPRARKEARSGSAVVKERCGTGMM